MKVLHVIPFGIFAVNYVNAFNKYNANSHTFWMYGYSKEHELSRNIYFDEEKNVMRIEKSEYSSLEKVYSNHEIIIFLCFPEDLELLKLIFICYRSCPKPYILSPWGRDADRTSDIYRRDEHEWKAIEQMKLWMAQNSTIIASTQRLYDVLQNLYHVKSTRLFFANNLLAFSVDKLVDLKMAKHDRLNIMVGHRGTSTSKHLEVFDAVGGYKKEIGYIFCPLSYGEKSYTRKVCWVGRLKFGSKWKPILEWMDMDSYMHFLNENVDVAIFASQFEGASTIYALVYMGKTLYLNEQSETAEILDELEVSYYKISSEYKEIPLKTISEVEKERNRKIMKEFGSIERFNVSD